MGWKGISRHSISEGSGLISNKEIMWALPAQWADLPGSGLTSLADQGDLAVFVGLITNFYGLKTKKIPAVGLASGD